MFPSKYPKYPLAHACAPHMDTADWDTVCGGMFSAIYGLHWIHVLIMETVQLHMVHVKEMLGRRLHCSAPRYQKGDDGKSWSCKGRADSWSTYIYQRQCTVGTGMEVAFPLPICWHLCGFILETVHQEETCRNLFWCRDSAFCNPQHWLAGFNVRLQVEFPNYIEGKPTSTFLRVLCVLTLRASMHRFFCLPVRVDIVKLSFCFNLPNLLTFPRWKKKSPNSAVIRIIANITAGEPLSTVSRLMFF